MPLPFLDPKKIAASVIATQMKKKKGDVEVAAEVEAPDSEMDAGLKEAAMDLMRAIEQKSVIDVGKALKAAFMVCDAMPHEEGPHLEEAAE